MLTGFDRALVRANRWAVIAMLAAMAASVFANVALRMTTDRSLLWVEEASRYLMIWITFLGSGLVLRYGGHVGIDTLQEALPRRAAAIRAAIFAVLLAFFVVMIVLGLRYAAFAWNQTTPVLQIPIGAVYLAMPIGFALATTHLLLMAGAYLRHGARFADGQDERPAQRSDP
jgi:TRAP-type C4-dicarboxylate transport system permease small subunit